MNFEVKASKKSKQFTDQATGRLVEYDERLIIIDGISYRVSKNEAKVFDLQFKDLLEESDEQE